MEADNVQDKPNMDEMDPKNINQGGADQDEVDHVGNAAQVQPDAVILVPKKAANLSSEKHFAFLDLPAEIRTIVYQCANTYEAQVYWLSQDACDFIDQPNLWQPPITRVNRQIRHECLHIFYQMFQFAIDLHVRSKGLSGHERYILLPTSDDQVSMQSLRKTVQAFAPSPTNMLQISNLCFLSRLAIRVHYQRRYEELACIGFDMASADRTKIAPMAVRGLDRNGRRAVQSAWVDAAKKRAAAWFWNLHGRRPENELGHSAHRAVVDEVLDLLSLFANHCPQLTRSIYLIYWGYMIWSDDLYDLAADLDGYQD